MPAFANPINVSHPTQQNLKHVYIIHAGGTIGMKRTENGYKPVQGYLQSLIDAMPEFQDERMPHYTIKEFEPLLDSCDMNRDDWAAIALEIKENYNKYDGFVVVHGTDTMAYSACSLSFMLENLAKTVILTGSQIPLSELRNDGRYNLISSVMIAGTLVIPEVCIFFDKHLYRGNRCKKLDIWGLKAFNSPNYPPLAAVGVDVLLMNQHLLPTPTSPFKVLTSMSEEVVAIRVIPGLSPSIIGQMLSGTNIRGVVLEAYGAGNLQERRRELLDVLKYHIDRGVIIVLVSQVPRGTVNMGVYATGQALRNIGVISGYDMTTEAATIKLQYLIGSGLTNEEIKHQMKNNLRGELTPPTPSTFDAHTYTEPPPIEQGVIPSAEEESEATTTLEQYHSVMKYFRPDTVPAQTVDHQKVEVL